MKAASAGPTRPAKGVIPTFGEQKDETPYNICPAMGSEQFLCQDLFIP